MARPPHRLLRDYEWVHTLLGVCGNLLFVVGSVLFLWESTKQLGTVLFIVGSALMFLGSAGAAVVRLERSRHPRVGGAARMGT